VFFFLGVEAAQEHGDFLFRIRRERDVNSHGSSEFFAPRFFTRHTAVNE
jgi:hypothetical protein